MATQTGHTDQAGAERRAKLERDADGLICGRCGHDDYKVREVTETYRVGNNTVTVTTLALVSEHCGEVLFEPVASKIVDRAVKALRDGTLEGLEAVGTAYAYKGD
jgi:hypothetical protein